MADNIIDIISVNKLAKKNYFIPAYQRGYRWGKQQVIDLLEDVSEFVRNNRDVGGYYCLQPIVVKKMNDEEISKFGLTENTDWYEVIDGQQRLTTIALLRHYINEHTYDKIGEVNLKYETRGTFLDKISNNPLTIQKDNIDLYHAQCAYNYIHAWYSEKREDEEFRSSIFEESFNKDVKVIWYEVDEKNNSSNGAIELFTRINMGKIPLTNAELIKAIFLRKHNNNSIEDLRQIEIAKEWDNIEFHLQNDDFWYFLNKSVNDKPARIEFIFDMMYELAKSNYSSNDFDSKYGNDDYKTFRFFAEKLKNGKETKVKEEWQKVLECYRALNEWFDDPTYYHYIGFLVISGTPINKIYQMYDGKPKDMFIDTIKDEISSKVKDVGCIKESGNYYFDLDYEKTKDKNYIRLIILLFNIQYMIDHHKNYDGNWYLRFPFDLYKKEKWDIEHINSYTTNELNNAKKQGSWLETAFEDLKSIDKDIEINNPTLYQAYNDFFKHSSNELFAYLKNEFAKYAGEDVEEEDVIKNSLGNLTLLNSSINRSYGNSLFISKRKRILEEDKNGRFIPICTKNVFLKYFDEKGTTRTVWTSKNGDYQSYTNEIGQAIEIFLNIENHE